jgi:hypothetical protein
MVIAGCSRDCNWNNLKDRDMCHPKCQLAHLDPTRNLKRSPKSIGRVAYEVFDVKVVTLPFS